MSELSIVAVNPVKVKIEEIELDVSIRESHQMENEVTEYPIETGGTITDHIFTKPSRVTIEGFITNSPVREVSDSSVARAGTRSDRASVAFESLKRIRDEKEIVTIITGLMTYTDMALTRLLIPRDKTNGQALWFTADFVKVSFARSETIQIDELQVINGTDKQAASEADKGNVSTTTASPEQSDAATILYNLTLGK